MQDTILDFQKNYYNIQDKTHKTQTNRSYMSILSIGLDLLFSNTLKKISVLEL